MGANSRNKGASAEREVFKLIGAKLGIDVKRNLTQTREGGYDTRIGIWSIEVKRQERQELTAWWAQACAQAGRAGAAYPMLLYRQSRRPWRCVVYAYGFINVFSGADACIKAQGLDGKTVDVDLDTAIELIRLNLGELT